MKKIVEISYNEINKIYLFHSEMQTYATLVNIFSANFERENKELSQVRYKITLNSYYSYLYEILHTHNEVANIGDKIIVDYKNSALIVYN